MEKIEKIEKKNEKNQKEMKSPPSDAQKTENLKSEVLNDKNIKEKLKKKEKKEFFKKNKDSSETFGSSLILPPSSTSVPSVSEGSEVFSPTKDAPKKGPKAPPAPKPEKAKKEKTAPKQAKKKGEEPSVPSTSTAPSASAAPFIPSASSSSFSPNPEAFAFYPSFTPPPVPIPLAYKPQEAPGAEDAAQKKKIRVKTKNSAPAPPAMPLSEPPKKNNPPAGFVLLKRQT